MDPAKRAIPEWLLDVAKVSAVLATAGFLGVRAYINGLGLPSHVSLSTQAYLEYGGRFVLSLLGRFMLWLFLFYLLGFVAVRIGIWFPKLQRWALQPVTMGIGVLVLGIIALAWELAVLDTAPLEAGVRPGIFRVDGRSAQIAIAEACLFVAVAWIAAVRRAEITAQLQGYARRGLALVTASTLAMALLLLPAAFGRVVLVPKQLDRVTIHYEKRELDGVLLFTDSHSHFVRAKGGELVELARSSVKLMTFHGKVDSSSLGLR